MNPSGQPCQMQDRVLHEMGAELKGKAEVVYYRTTVPADIAKFQQYGIRSLPTLIVTDATGKEIRRATPGIQSAAQVRQLVAALTAMDVGLSSLALTFGAGLASVASPCVLPVLPIILTGTAEDHRSRPALIVAGIAASFVAMGVVTSLFGGAIGPALPYLEKVFGVMVVGFGLLLLADVNLFKKLTWGTGSSPAGRGAGPASCSA